ncbi:MAG TPA: F0F1 ATP synthase subunit B [Candidatus Polarisedimenticolaceae bacterium]|nr:F0F1 ATP synthase subunit B [Candidatus Polarisedimenticolaceae bacterium]
MRRGRFLLGGILGLAVVPAAAEEGGGLAQQLIQPQIGTIFWTLLTFLLMVILLGRFAWKPLLGALDARERSVRDGLDGAKRARDEAEALLQQQRQLVAEARRERAEALDKGRRDGETLKTEILAQARAQREQLLKQTESQVEALLRQGRLELRGATAELAIRAAEKLLGQRLDDAAHRRLVDEHLADLERAAESQPTGSA